VCTGGSWEGTNVCVLMAQERGQLMYKGGGSEGPNVCLIAVQGRGLLYV
jgi:hypothetical protein